MRSGVLHPRTAGDLTEYRVLGTEYYFCGAAGFCAGAAGCVFTGCDFTSFSTDVGPPLFVTSTDKVMDVIMNATADHVVALESALAAPRGPNAVWLP